MEAHKLSLEEVYSSLRSSDKGLTQQEAELRLQQYGQNTFHKKKRGVIVFKFLKQFTNFFALLLLVGSLIAFIAEQLAPYQGHIYISIALVGVVILNAIFTFFQEYRAERIMDSFQSMLPPKAEVLREGKRQTMLAELLVPGDIIFITEGDKIPADGRLMEVNELKVDHSSITGESEPQLRTIENTHPNILESRNMVFSGTLVQSGNGKAVVYATGEATEIGKIASLTRGTQNVQGPLQKEITRFVRMISIIAISLGVLFFVIGTLLGQPLLGSLIFAIGIIVANVPEGLLPTVTLGLSIASRRMAKRNALIRSLESVETLGSTTVICTDKTGTITQNKMVVNSFFVNFALRETAQFSTEDKETKNLFLKTMVLCNNARLEGKKTAGDPTETSLLDFALSLTDVSSLRENELRVQEFPFDSKTKRMITVHKKGNKTRAYMKGAPEIVIKQCSLAWINGTVQRLTPARKEKVTEAYRDIASRGERVLALAYKDATPLGKEDSFVFLGLVGMYDPPRPEVPEAIAKCKTAGIRIIMITGDHRWTAEAIARNVGLLEGKDDTVVSGEDLDKLDEAQLQKVLQKRNIIFFRTNPLHKLRIVKALQSMGEVVTVTGDGVNDAPALKNADMGVAMGISGTEVAREASDMILLDDNFATIVNAVEEGRTIFDNIKKFISYILTSNVPEIIPFIALALVNVPLALTVVLILAIDLGTDLFPAIALATEKPESDVMKQKPRARTERLLTKQMLFRSYIILGMIQAAAAFFAFFTLLIRGGWTWGTALSANDPLYQEAVTAAFAAIVICQIANVLVSRTRRETLWKIGILSNKYIWAGILSEIVLLLLIIYVPLFNFVLGTRPLSPWEFLLGVPFALLLLIVDEGRKVLVQRNVPVVVKYLSW